ncbi:hypothetical protein GCM10010937_00670 [Gluconobacter japonicus]|uniref:Uncharacterized protein n=1 Tax=Gluconobacter japonicus TaxID=376620 RepID=A0ABQ5WDW0_GLUJA|nr:hypothetical protein GCM10010937_00670 [Gluconobacter japonicus]
MSGGRSYSDECSATDGGVNQPDLMCLPKSTGDSGKVCTKGGGNHPLSGKTIALSQYTLLD